VSFLPGERRAATRLQLLAADMALLPPSLTLRRFEKASAWQARLPVQIFAGDTPASTRRRLSYCVEKQRLSSCIVTGL